MFNPEVNYEFNPEDEDRKIVTSRPDGTTDELDEAAADKWLVQHESEMNEWVESRESEIEGRIEQFKIMQLKEELDDLSRGVEEILKKYGYENLSPGAIEQFRQLREEQIEQFYAEHSQDLVKSIIGDLK